MSNNTKLLYLCLKAQTIAKSSEQGYSMAVVSIITIILFSLMVAATVLSNMAKARTNAFVDSNSAFYVAEAGLNRRSAEISDLLKNSTVRTAAGSPTSIDNCLDRGIPAGGLGVSARSGTNDLECVNYRFRSSNNIARSASGKDIVLDSGNQDLNTYVAYTFVRDTTTLDAAGLPPYNVIPAGEPFAGLNANSYTYVVSSAGRKPVALPNTSGAATATAAKDSSNNVTLQMTFVNRVVPLFQFGIFYNGDLELNSSSNMQINGWVHSNANMYLQPAAFSGGTPTTTFTDNVSAFGSIYNRVDAWTDSADNAISPTTTTGTTRLQLNTTPTFRSIPTYSGSTDPLTPIEIAAFNAVRAGSLRDNAAGATRLKVPSPSFGRKRNYLDNTIGESFAKADIRLEMVPDRDIVAPGGTTSNTVGGKAATPWTRNRAIIPFNFTAIKTTGAGACTTTTPTAGSDPVATYVDPKRENLANLRCNIFTKGQLQSLRQPVMVLTALNATPARTGLTAAQITTQEQTALGGSPVAVPARLTAVSVLPIATRTAIARALQVAIVSHPTPVPLNNFNDPFNGPSFGAGSPLVLVRTRFQNLLSPGGTPIAGLTGTHIGNLIQSSPNEIAALVGGWFLPAPIQRIEPTDPNPASVIDAPNNRRGGGFYDSREQRWMATLQTNIASLSVWNRDGLYVEDTNDTALTSAYNPLPTDITAAFALGIGTNFTNGLAFDRVTVFTNAGGEIYAPGSLQSLGLGARDTTEGGLVFHATVNDDLNGDGAIDTNDINETTSPITVIDTSGASVTVDYLRSYPNETVSRRSPFAFAFNGGNYLPSGMTLYSDQAIYVQGNFNNNATNPASNNFDRTIEDANRLPAAIVADTITVLSNQCVNSVNPSGVIVGGANPLAVPIGQVTCAYPPLPLGGTFNNVTSALSINAAFLSNTEVSIGNLGAGRGYPASPSTYSGGANNYIRLLENWQNGGNPFALNYTGSLVSLGQPNENSGRYRAGGFGGTGLATYYDVPFRVITFDNNFQDNTRLPPLTPKASYVRQSSFSRTY
jgi:Tfp pilus assembly protein PilX